MSPVRTFGEVPHFLAAEEDFERRAHEIVREVRVPPRVEDEPLTIYITRIGGLFAQPPLDFGDEQADESEWPRKREFEQRVAAAMNVLLCELAVRGVWSEPVAPIHLGEGGMRGATATIGAMAFHPETGGLERAHGPLAQLRSRDLGHLMQWTVRGKPESVLDEAAKLTVARQLLAMSPTLPLFLTTTFAMFVRRRASESITNAWIVCEQILNDLWDRELVARKVNSAHGESMQRAEVTAAIRHDVLTALNVLDADLYKPLRRARKNRNDLMHAAGTDITKAEQCVSAMCELLRAITGADVIMPDLAVHDDSLAW